MIRMEVIKITTFSYEDILKNNNLIFNLKNDWTFKNVFLNEVSLDYLCYFFSYILGYDYFDLKSNLIIVNGEIPSKVLGHNNGHSDIIFKYKKIYIILEMNGSNKNIHIDKNYWYLFLEHSSRLSNKNNYSQDIKTILINIDNYDVLSKNDFIYDSKLLFEKYKDIIYKGIRILHINLDYLKKKHYTEDKLNEFEKSMLMFVEQDRRKIEKNVKRKDVEEIMNFLETLKFKPGDAVTYDREEFLKICEKDIEKRTKEVEKAEEKIENKMSQIETQMSQIENEKFQIENEKSQIENEKSQIENEKINFAKVLKKQGISSNKIMKMTNLSIDKIMML